MYSSFSKNIKIIAEDGNYTLTFYLDQPDVWQVYGDYTSNLLYVLYGEKDLRIVQFEIMKEIAYAEADTSSTIGYSVKNMIPGYDLPNSGFTDAIKKLVSEENDDNFYDTKYEVLSDGTLTYTVVLESIPEKLFLHGLFECDKHSYGTEIVETEYWPFSQKLTLDVDKVVKLPETFDGIDGNVSFNYDFLGSRGIFAFRTTTAEAVEKDGKLYVTYDINLDGLVKKIDNGLSAELLDEDYNPITIENNKVTLVYESIDEIIRGKRVIFKTEE